MRNLAENKKEILVPLDFDSVSDVILNISFRLAKAIDATITLLNVCPDKKKLSEVSISGITNTIEEKIKNGDLQKAVYKIVIKKGVPEAEILKYSEDHEVFLIIMDTRVKQDKQQELIGSVTAEVIDGSTIPVLVIPKGIEFNLNSSVFSVGLASSMKEFDDLTFQNFMSFMETFPNLKMELTMVHIKEKGEKAENYEAVMHEMEQYVEQFHKGIKTSYALIPMDKSVSTDLITFFQSTTFNLLVIKNNLRYLFTRLFKTSIAKKLVYHAQIPLLIFPNDERPITKLSVLH